jgi:hypothetical protein
MLGVARPIWTLKRRKPRADAATKKNSRILTTVKAMKPFGQVSIPGRLTQPII